MKKINSWDEFKEIDQATPFFFLKNSTTCPISQTAYEETEKFAEDHADLPIYYLNVQESRELSNCIAEEFNIKHESPQIFLFSDNQVRYHDSHWNITYSSLGDVVKKNV
ncbi:bacillithiol system redox-active protein YtxJ [Bacillus sp. Marseille-Q3570]|uniref:bacillithiol system redox-active protein YtxJ n=1 Tax=Bacillus sp. Marseille-Q3570 TaxID=2963522 RepID=UPI0021B768D0|nr:bacillithiol system redox-active protein YtxJ [Bacillus sp. Marseille-Q3570]